MWVVRRGDRSWPRISSRTGPAACARSARSCRPCGSAPPTTAPRRLGDERVLATAGSRIQSPRSISPSSCPGPSPRARRTPAAARTRRRLLGEDPVPSTPTSSNAISAASVGSSNSPGTITAEGWTGPPMNSCSASSTSSSSCGTASPTVVSDGRLRTSPSAPSSVCSITSTTVRQKFGSSSDGPAIRSSAARGVHQPAVIGGRCTPTFCYSTRRRSPAAAGPRTPARSPPRIDLVFKIQTGTVGDHLDRSMPTQTSAPAALPAVARNTARCRATPRSAPRWSFHDRLHLFASFLVSQTQRSPHYLLHHLRCRHRSARARILTARSTIPSYTRLRHGFAAGVGYFKGGTLGSQFGDRHLPHRILAGYVAAQRRVGDVSPGLDRDRDLA